MMASCAEESQTRVPTNLRFYPQAGRSPSFLDSGNAISARRYGVVIPEPIDSVLPFLHIGLDSSEPSANIKYFIESVFLEDRAKTISQKLDSISTEAELLLRGDFEITRNLEQALNCLRAILENFAIQNFIAVSSWRDPEAPDFETLELIVKVDARDFSSILRLWKMTDERIYETLSPTAKKKIIVIFERL